MIQPLFNADNDQWVVMTGRYILNMGAVEMATRLLIAQILGNNTAHICRDDLSARIGFIRSRFPKSNSARHKWAMNAFEVANKHTGFRNIIAHSPLAITGHANGTFKIQGIIDLTPKDKSLTAQLISLEELTSRVDEAAMLGRQLLEMQNDFITSVD